MLGNLLPFLMLGILLAAALSKPLARLWWLSLPVVLVLAGFVSSEVWVGLGYDTGLRWELLRDLVFYLLLPILIFDAAIRIDVRWLRQDALLIGLLSVPLLLIAAGLTASIVLFFLDDSFRHSWALALLLGSMISATDPAMISGLIKGDEGDGGVPRVERILEGESLINDATTITLFFIISGLLLAPGTEIDAASVLGRFVLVLCGGALVGIVLGWLLDLVIAPANDKVLSTSATIVLAFSSFWVSEHLLGLSGVVATLSAGLTIAWRQRQHRTEEDIAFALDSWQMLGFCATAMLFFVVGMSITVQMFVTHWLPMMVGVLAALVSRAAIVFLGVGPVSRVPGVGRVSLREQNLLLWGGIRGAVAIALALSLSVDVPEWYLIQSTVYGVALFSLAAQPLVLHRLAGTR